MACGPHTLLPTNLTTLLFSISPPSSPPPFSTPPFFLPPPLSSNSGLWVFSDYMERRRDDQAAKERRPKREELPVDDDDYDDEDTPTEDDKRKRTTGMAARRIVGAGGGGQTPPPSCQAERCTADLSEAKKYHRRHKVCEHHAKAPVVLVAGLHQRFCQQCSRFHELSEFDDTKRSCRRRLAGHNERRRKSSSTETQAESSGRSRGGSSQLKENQCRQADQSGRVKTNLPTSANFKHFQIR